MRSVCSVSPKSTDNKWQGVPSLDLLRIRVCSVKHVTVGSAPNAGWQLSYREYNGFVKTALVH